MQDHVAQRVHVEVVVVGRKFDAPLAHCAVELEGQVAIVVEVQLEQPRIVLAGGCRDRLGGRVLPHHARIVRASLVSVARLALVAAMRRREAEQRIDARRAAQQGQTAVDAVVRSGDAGNGQRGVA